MPGRQHPDPRCADHDGDVDVGVEELTGRRWGDHWAGGLVTTCGLSNVGAASDGHGLHGTYSHRRARDVSVPCPARDRPAGVPVPGVSWEPPGPLRATRAGMRRRLALALGVFAWGNPEHEALCGLRPRAVPEVGSYARALRGDEMGPSGRRITISTMSCWLPLGSVP